MVWWRGALDRYVASAPSPQNALDIFEGAWTSRLPSPFENARVGATPLFEDERLAWAIDDLGGFDGARIVELGPLEGGHTYMLQRAGAASVVAIEGNRRAYLKCLVVKELLALQRARFLCGDFVSISGAQMSASISASRAVSSTTCATRSSSSSSSAAERNVSTSGRTSAPAKQRRPSSVGGSAPRTQPSTRASSTSCAATTTVSARAGQGSAAAPTPQ